MTAPDSVDSAGFEHTHPRTRIVAGAGTHRRLPELLAELPARSVFVVCSRTVAAGPQLAAVREVLGEAIAGVFDGIRPQAGMTSLADAAQRLAGARAGAVLSLGGGATIDTAKYLILLLSRRHPVAEYQVPKGRGRGARPARALVETSHPHIAIPTTAGSSSEIMPWAGIRDEAHAEKVLFCDRLLEPDLAVLDPLLVVPTGPELTASSGVTAIARAVEAAYSRQRQPVADAYAVAALRLLAAGVPRSIAAPADLAARGQAQVGAMLSGIAAHNAMVSVVHAVGHAVGGRYALQHGIAHRILLPPVAARLLPAAGDTLPRLAASLDLPAGPGRAESPGRPLDPAVVAGQVAGRLAELFDALPVPARLREVGVARSHLPELARAAATEPMLAYSPREVPTAELEQLLESCW